MSGKLKGGLESNMLFLISKEKQNSVGPLIFLFRYVHKLFGNGHLGLIKFSKTTTGHIGMFIAVKMGNTG